MPPAVPAIVIYPDALGTPAMSGLSGVTPVHVPLGDPVPEAAAGAQVLVVGEQNVLAALDLMGQLPDLRLVQTLVHGSNQWEGRIPEGVALATARGAHGGATAEWVVAALLAIVRDFPAYVREQPRHTWKKRVTRSLMGTTALVLGAGDVAENVKARLSPFDCAVTLVGTHARSGVISLEEARSRLKETDSVIVVLPLTEATAHIVNADFLARMRDGAILVNAGRGPLVDQNALLAELKTRRLRAALDVTDPEPLPADNPLWDAPGLFITPHVGGSVEFYVERSYSVAATQIAAFLAGGRPSNLVIGVPRG